MLTKEVFETRNTSRVFEQTYLIRNNGTAIGVITDVTIFDPESDEIVSYWQYGVWLDVNGKNEVVQTMTSGQIHSVLQEATYE